MKKYTEQQKLDAVETYRSGELGLKKTAALHGVDVASLRKWVAGYEALGIAGIRYYNHDRIRCGLRGMSPVEYRELAVDPHHHDGVSAASGR